MILVCWFTTYFQPIFILIVSNEPSSKQRKNFGHNHPLCIEALITFRIHKINLLSMEVSMDLSINLFR